MIGPLIQGTALGTFLLLGGALPRERSQGFVTKDTLLNVVNGLLLFGVKVALVDAIVGHLSMGWLSTSILAEPWQQFVVAFLLLDFSRYWLHRAHHRVPFLWTFHRVHHMTERLDATAGLRMHIVDFILIYRFNYM